MFTKATLSHQEPTDTQPGYAVYEDLFDDREHGNLGPIYLKLMRVPVELRHDTHESHLTVTLTRECSQALGYVLLTNGPAKATYPAEDNERLKRVLTVLEKAKQLLGSLDAAVNWIHTRNYSMGGSIPMDLMGTDSGMKIVLDQIQQQSESAPL